MVSGAGRGQRFLIAVGVVSLALAACSGDGSAGGDDETETGSPAAAAGDWEPTYDGDVLQPLDDGFPDQPITLLNADEPGSDDGLYARTIQQALNDISPVDIQVQDRPSPTYGTWEALDWIGNQPGGDEGYINLVAAMTGGPLDLLMVPITDELGITKDDINPVIATETSPFVLASRTGAPWEDYEGMVAYAKDHPGELRYAARLGSQLDIAMERLMAEGDWEAEKLPVGDLDEAATVLGAGEADFSMLLPGIAKTHSDANRLVVLLAVGDNVPDAFSDTAVSTSDIGMPDEPWGSVRGFMIPADVSDAHRAWLYELFRAATDTDVYAQRVSNLPGGELVTLDHDAVMKIVNNTLDFADPVLRDLGLHVDQQ